ncbi:hypothetical protein Leryth_010576 [Lithospermum erythrorhizon]|nr:hypothetical protein Leryth_010576 [Lithospermum erythrorhizon]
MKWTSLLKDFKEKVGSFQSGSASSTPRSSASTPASSKDSNFDNSSNAFASSSNQDFSRPEEKENALNLTVEVFCRLVKQQANVAQLISMLVETHIFSFVVGRAFVTDIEKLKLSSKTRSLEGAKVLNFFSEISKDGIEPGANLLHAVEVLQHIQGRLKKVSNFSMLAPGLCVMFFMQPIDKQSLLDSGILCCLIHILNALLSSYDGIQLQKVTDDEKQVVVTDNSGSGISIRLLEVEGSVVHIMKALSSHPSAAQSLIEDNSLQLLFQMVADGSLVVFSKYKQGLVPLHAIQLHRHAMQILGLLLVNDNGSTAKYIHKHHLVKVLLMAVKDFNP